VYLGVGGTITLLDITNPLSPVEVSKVETPGSAVKILKTDDYLFVANGYWGLRIIDISDPYNPVEVGNYEEAEEVLDVFIVDDYAYIAAETDGLMILDISNPLNPILVGTYDEWPIELKAITVSENYAYVADCGRGLKIIDVNDPSNPFRVGSIEGDYIANSIYQFDNFACFGASNQGFIIVDVSDPTQPVEIANLYSGDWVWDVDGSENMVFLATDATNGVNFRVLDLSDPYAVVEVSEYYDVATDGEQISFYGNYVFWTSTYNGLRIMDISNPASPTKINTLSTSGPCYDVTVSNNYAYVVNNDLHILDISDPSNPIEVGSYITPLFEDGSAVYVNDNYAYMSGHEGLQIIDVTDPTNPLGLGSFLTLKGDLPHSGIFVSGEYLFLLRKDVFGFVIIDLTDPSSPIEVNRYSVEHSGARNMYLIDNYAYVTYGGNEENAYRALHIIDVSNPSNLIEVGILDMPELTEDGIAFFVNQDYAYIGSLDNIVIVDVKNPSKPSRVSNFKVFGVLDIVVKENILYATAYGNGVFMYDVSNPHNIIEVGNIGEQTMVAQSVHNKYNLLFICDYSYGMYLYEDQNAECNNRYYRDTDGDMYGDANDDLFACIPPEGYVSDNTDNCPGTYNPEQGDNDGDGCGDVCDGRPNNPNWLTISGTISLTDGIPLCAMVLANGQYMFTCTNDVGVWDLTVPLNEYGQIRLYGFCSGLAPFVADLWPNQALSYDIGMVTAPVDAKEMTVTIQTKQGTNNSDWIRISGVVTYNGTPLCVIVLANGQHMFTCNDPLGSYDMEVPLDGNGEILLYVFCSGMLPYQNLIKP
jgi:hypothetical protein